MTYIPKKPDYGSTSFKELEIVAPNPVIEGSGVYNLIPANFRTFDASGGAVTVDNRLFKISTGTSSGGYAVSLGSTTDLVIRVNSFSAFVEGAAGKTRNPRAIASTTAITTTDETVVLAVRNRRTYNSINNQIEIEPLRVGLANETARNAIVRVRAATLPGVELAYTSVGNNLVSDFATDAAVFSGGLLLATEPVGPTQKVTIDLKDLDVSQPSSLHLIITVQRTATGGSNNNFSGSYTWYEDL